MGTKTVIKQYDTLSNSENERNRMMPRNKHMIFSLFNNTSTPIFKLHTSIGHNLFSVPFDINTETLPADFNMEMTEMLCDMHQRNTF
jgi:hypothetical protein